MDIHVNSCIKLYLLMLLYTLVTARSSPRCEEPKTLPDIRFDLMMNITQAQTFSLLPRWSRGNEGIVPNEYINVKHKYYKGKANCKKPKMRNGQSRDNTINSLSQCMWRYVKNIDTNRKPKTILEVECICHYPLYAKKKSGLVCQSIVEYMVVFRRTGCTNDVYDYKLVWEPRAVACVATTLPEPQRLYTVAYKMIE